jgi:hypothetical protein
MSKRIILSVFLITMTVTAVATATYAYFFDDEIVTGNTFSTGTVTIGDTWQLPLTFTGLYPGAEQESSIFAVRYTGSINGDLYYGLRFTPGFDNLEDVLSIQIARVTSTGDHITWIYGDWTPVTWPFQNWTKVADGLNQNEWAYYKLYVRMSDSANNTFQNKTAKNDIVLYAIQEGETPDGIPLNYPN